MQFFKRPGMPGLFFSARFGVNPLSPALPVSVLFRVLINVAIEYAD